MTWLGRLFHRLIAQQLPTERDDLREMSARADDLERRHDQIMERRRQLFEDEFQADTATRRQREQHS